MFAPADANAVPNMVIEELLARLPEETCAGGLALMCARLIIATGSVGNELTLKLTPGGSRQRSALHEDVAISHLNQDTYKDTRARSSTVRAEDS